MERKFFEFDLTELYQWPDLWDVLLSPSIDIAFRSLENPPPAEHRPILARIEYKEWKEG